MRSRLFCSAVHGSVLIPLTAQAVVTFDWANGFNDGYAATGSTSYIDLQNYLTDVGAYTNADSFYGTFDQGGNVWEWNETLAFGSSRDLRGGSWNFSLSDFLRSDLRNVYDVPSDEYGFIGFRLASIPEPASSVMGIGLGVVTLMRRGGRA